MTTLLYRPFRHDDWGMIRYADGKLFAVVRRPLGDDEAAEHRCNGTDPFEDLARRLIGTYAAAPRRRYSMTPGQRELFALRRVSTKCRKPPARARATSTACSVAWKNAAWSAVSASAAAPSKS
jgi:hypothetical protein